jgi:tetratricopeptide (TPR) repeat protein
VVVAYGWELGPYALGQGDRDESLKQDRQFPHDLTTPIGRMGYDMFRKAALKLEEMALAAEKERKWLEAWDLWQRFSSTFDRFRDPAIIHAAREGYLICARCALNAGYPALALRALSQFFSSGDSTPEAIEVKRVAGERDAKLLQEMKDMLTATQASEFRVRKLLQHAVDYPRRERLALAEELLNRFPKYAENPSIVAFDRANLDMAEGKWREAVEVLTPLVEVDAEIKGPLTHWRNMMQPGGGREGVYFGGVPEDCDLGVPEIVNRGFGYLANAFYEDALQWLLFALVKDPADPFALFGHALCLWQKNMFVLAADRLRLAIARMEEYASKFRFLGFSRLDETAPARSYRFDPIYMIFNPGECLSQVLSLQGFVSHVLIP